MSVVSEKKRKKGEKKRSHKNKNTLASKMYKKDHPEISDAGSNRVKNTTEHSPYCSSSSQIQKKLFPLMQNLVWRISIVPLDVDKVERMHYGKNSPIIVK